MNTLILSVYVLKRDHLVAQVFDALRCKCDVVRLSKELVGHRSIWRRPKYLRLCFADNY